MPEPDEEQLADIAISSARTAAQFGIVPRVAMLSYSTGESGVGADSTRAGGNGVGAPACPELLVAGPIQYDAAVDPSVAASQARVVTSPGARQC